MPTEGWIDGKGRVDGRKHELNALATAGMRMISQLNMDRRKDGATEGRMDGWADTSAYHVCYRRSGGMLRGAC